MATSHVYIGGSYRPIARPVSGGKKRVVRPPIPAEVAHPLGVEPKLKKSAEMTGAMVCLWLGADDRFPVQDDLHGMLHVTLAYLGKADSYSPTTRQTIEDVTRVMASTQPPFKGRANGLTMWDTPDGQCLSVPVDIPGLGAFRERLVQALSLAGATVAANHDFSAHMTMGEPWVGPLPERPREDVEFHAVTVAFGPDREHIPLGIVKANPNHEPAGTPKGGQFASAGWSAGTIVHDSTADLEALGIDPASPQAAAFRAALDRTNRTETRLVEGKQVTLEFYAEPDAAALAAVKAELPKVLRDYPLPGAQLHVIFGGTGSDDLPGVTMPSMHPDRIDLNAKALGNDHGLSAPWVARPAGVSAAAYVLRHEYGHLYTYAHPASLRAASQLYDAGRAHTVSNYAAEKPDELAAEAFAAWSFGQRGHEAVDWIAQAGEFPDHVTKFNPNHEPAGSPKGGQFTSSRGAGSTGQAGEEGARRTKGDRWQEYRNGAWVDTGETIPTDESVWGDYAGSDQFAELSRLDAEARAADDAFAKAHPTVTLDVRDVNPAGIADYPAHIAAIGKALDDMEARYPGLTTNVGSIQVTLPTEVAMQGVLADYRWPVGNEPGRLRIDLSASSSQMPGPAERAIAAGMADGNPWTTYGARTGADLTYGVMIHELSHAVDATVRVRDEVAYAKYVDDTAFRHQAEQYGYDFHPTVYSAHAIVQDAAWGRYERGDGMGLSISPPPTGERNFHWVPPAMARTKTDYGTVAVADAGKTERALTAAIKWSAKTKVPSRYSATNGAEATAEIIAQDFLFKGKGLSPSQKTLAKYYRDHMGPIVWEGGTILAKAEPLEIAYVGDTLEGILAGPVGEWLKERGVLKLDVEKLNPYHDERGRFSSSPSGGASSGKGVQAPKGEHHVGEEHIDRVLSRTSSSQDVPIESVRPRGVPDPKSVRNARFRMHEAAHGRGEPRKPIAVRRTAKGNHKVVDGNATYHAAKAMGWKKIRVEVEDDVAKFNRNHKGPGPGGGQFTSADDGGEAEDTSSHLRPEIASMLADYNARGIGLDRLKSHGPEVDAEIQRVAGFIHDDAANIGGMEVATLAAVAGDHDHGHLVGIQFRVKSQDSIARKVAADMHVDHTSPREAGDLIGDGLRFTTEFTEHEFGHSVMGMMDDLGAKGYRVLKWKNTFGPGHPYQGINANLVTPGGRVIEMQFHTAASHSTKEYSQHPIYRVRREIAGNTADTRRMDAETARLASLVPLPDGWNAIPNYATGTLGTTTRPRVVTDGVAAGRLKGVS